MNHTRLAVLLLAVAACGCYEAATPLGPPGAVAVDPAMVGAWQCVPPPENRSDERATLLVMPFDESQYVAEWTDEGKKPDRYRVYGTRAGSQLLMNVRSLEPRVERESWVFLRCRIDAAGRLTLAIVQDKALEGLGEREALDAIRARAADDSIYEAVAVCTRAPE